MATTNTVALRPRFKIELARNNESVLKAFEQAKFAQNNFIITWVDNHVFIKYPKYKQHVWSPQLHLEISAENSQHCIINGLFGPSPTVWTFFMFLHFMVAALFIAFGIWAYSNWRLHISYALQTTLMLVMVIVWVVLYFAGSIGKISGNKDMRELQKFMNSVLEK